MKVPKNEKAAAERQLLLDRQLFLAGLLWLVASSTAGWVGHWVAMSSLRVKSSRGSRVSSTPPNAANPPTESTHGAKCATGSWFQHCGYVMMGAPEAPSSSSKLDLCAHATSQPAELAAGTAGVSAAGTGIANVSRSTTVRSTTAGEPKAPLRPPAVSGFDQKEQELAHMLYQARRAAILRGERRDKVETVIQSATEAQSVRLRSTLSSSLSSLRC